MKTSRLFGAGRTRSFLWIALVIGFAVSPGWKILRAAGHVPETTPRKGEKRFSQFVYKASHNSFVRDDALDKQVDDFNVWQLELDIAWDTNGGGGTFNGVVVDHDCLLGKAQTLGDSLNELSKSKTLNSRFTVIMMELKDPNNNSQSCRDAWPARDVYRADISNAIVANLTFDRVYTPDEFDSIDNLTWPSMQELLRRGKNYCIVLNEIVTGQVSSPFFFNKEFDNPPNPAYADNRILYSLNGGFDLATKNDAVVDESQIANKDRYLWRAYPGRANCLDTNGDGDDSFWNKMVNRGFNFVASNCVDDNDQILDTRTHAPQPLYVDKNDLNNKQYGTHGYPVNLLESAMVRASPSMVDIMIKPGTYSLLPGFNVMVKPMTFKANGGAVTIRK